MGDMADYYEARDDMLADEGLVPCDWCDRETQETCPTCKGTGFIDRSDDDE